MLRWRQFAAAVLAAWIIYFAAERWLIASVQIDPRYAHAGVSASVAAWIFREAMGVTTLLACALFAAYCRRIWLRRVTEEHLMFFAATGICSLAIVFTLFYQGVEPAFYQLMPLIEHPQTDPVVGHRLLFVWPAQILHHLYPSLTSKSLLILSQVPAALFTSIMVGLWSAVFVGRRLAFLGQCIMLVFLIPTISYYNFYDIAIVGFYAATLLAVIRNRFWLTVPLIALATLNHENAMLLIPAVGFAAQLFWPYRKAFALVGAALCAHIAVRLILWHFMPMPSSADVRFYSNAIMLLKPSLPFLVGVAFLAFRWLCALLGWKSAPPALKRMALIWPLLFLVTLAFGQFNEIRQFDADIPLAVGLLLVYVKRSFGLLDVSVGNQSTPAQFGEAR